MAGERALDAALRERARSAGLAAGVAACLLVLLWSVFDHLLEPERAGQFLALRAGGEVPMLALLGLLWRSPVGRRRPELLVMLLLSVVQLEIAWMLPRVTHAPQAYALGFSLVLYASGCLLGGRPRWTGGLVAISGAALVTGLLTGPSDQDARDVATVVFYFGTAAVIGLLGHLQRYRLAVRELTALGELEREQRRARSLLVQLEQLSYEDGLTGLANRRRWDAALAAECEGSRSRGSRFAVVLVDLDRFKAINDRYGHVVGDEALRTVAALLRAQTEPADVCARLGGDEFAVLLRGADVAAATALAEAVRVQAARARPAGDDGPALSLSLGVVSVAGPAVEPSAVMSAADAQLYLAKATRGAVSAAPGTAA